MSTSWLTYCPDRSRMLIFNIHSVRLHIFNLGNQLKLSLFPQTDVFFHILTHHLLSYLMHFYFYDSHRITAEKSVLSSYFTTQMKSGFNTRLYSTWTFITLMTFSLHSRLVTLFEKFETNILEKCMKNNRIFISFFVQFLKCWVWCCETISQRAKQRRRFRFLKHYFPSQHFNVNERDGWPLLFFNTSFFPDSTVWPFVLMDDTITDMYHSFCTSCVSRMPDP